MRALNTIQELLNWQISRDQNAYYDLEHKMLIQTPVAPFTNMV